MPGQDHDEGDISFSLPAAVDDWLAAEAARRDEGRDDVCRRLVAAAHAVATDDDHDLADRGELDEIRGQLEAQREECLELVEDARSHVIQLKRELDGMAPADHDHPSYATVDDLDALRDEFTALENALDGGFDNYETVLEELLERTDTLETRTTVLAQAVVELQDRQERSAEQRHRQAATESLKQTANRLGIRTAVCDDCGSNVDLALLTEPACPHCASSVTDVEKRSSIFGSHRLLTGDPPALEGRVDGEDDADAAAADLFEDHETDADATATTHVTETEDDMTTTTDVGDIDR